VRSYFGSAGLPAGQIAVVGATYQVGGGGAMVTTPASEQIQLGSLNSVLKRSIRGVPVADSFAAARMTTAGQVDWEAVFWPPISTSLVNDAVAFSSSMSDPVQHDAFVGRLGTVYRDVGVVIHHSSSYFHGSASAYVSYDAVIDHDSMAVARHFDANGVEFRLPQEQTRGQPNVK
jgi:hypothetical protein